MLGLVTRQQLVQDLHSRPVPSPATCRAAFKHDQTAQILSILIVIGLIISYLPQVSARGPSETMRLGCGGIAQVQQRLADTVAACRISITGSLHTRPLLDSPRSSCCWEPQAGELNLGRRHTAELGVIVTRFDDECTPV